MESRERSEIWTESTIPSEATKSQTIGWIVHPFLRTLFSILWQVVGGNWESVSVLVPSKFVMRISCGVPASPS